MANLVAAQRMSAFTSPVELVNAATCELGAHAHAVRSAPAGLRAGIHDTVVGWHSVSFHERCANRRKPKESQVRNNSAPSGAVA
jgi:hypothetical protein